MHKEIRDEGRDDFWKNGIARFEDSLVGLLDGIREEFPKHSDCSDGQRQHAGKRPYSDGNEQNQQDYETRKRPFGCQQTTDYHSQFRARGDIRRREEGEIQGDASAKYGRYYLWIACGIARLKRRCGSCLQAISYR